MDGVQVSEMNFRRSNSWIQSWFNFLYPYSCRWVAIYVTPEKTNLPNLDINLSTQPLMSITPLFLVLSLIKIISSIAWVASLVKFSSNKCPMWRLPNSQVLGRLLHQSNHTTWPVQTMAGSILTSGSIVVQAGLTKARQLHVGLSVSPRAIRGTRTVNIIDQSSPTSGGEVWSW